MTIVKKTQILLALFFFLAFNSSLLAEQMGDFPLEKLNCTFGKGKLSIEKEKINSKYFLYLLRLEVDKSEVALSSIGAALHRKCYFYFFSLDPSKDLFEMRLQLSKNNLIGNLALTKPKRLTMPVNCQLSKQQKNIISKSCKIKEPKQVLENSQIKRYMPSSRALGLDENNLDAKPRDKFKANTSKKSKASD